MLCAGSCPSGSSCKEKPASTTSGNCTTTTTGCACVDPQTGASTPVGCSATAKYTKCGDVLTGVSIPPCPNTGCPDDEECTGQRHELVIGNLKFFYNWCDCVKKEDGGGGDDGDGDDGGDGGDGDQHYSSNGSRPRRGAPLPRIHSQVHFGRDATKDEECDLFRRSAATLDPQWAQWMARHDLITGSIAAGVIDQTSAEANYRAETDAVLRAHFVRLLGYETLVSIAFGDGRAASPSARAEAALALAEWPSTETFGILAELIESEHLEVSAAAASVYMSFGSAAVPPRARAELQRLAMEEQDPRVRDYFSLIVRALGI